MSPGKIPTRLWQLVTAAKSAWLCRFALVLGVALGAALAQQICLRMSLSRTICVRWWT